MAQRKKKASSRKRSGAASASASAPTTPAAPENSTWNSAENGHPQEPPRAAAPRGPSKPKQETTKAEVFVIFTRPEKGHNMIDAVETREEATVIGREYKRKTGEAPVLETRDALVTTIRDGRGKKGTVTRAVFLLDPDCDHGKEFASGDYGSIAVTRQQALEKLTHKERVALGLADEVLGEESEDEIDVQDEDDADDEDPDEEDEDGATEATTSEPSEAGSAASPASAEDVDDESDDEEEEDENDDDDPFAEDDN